MPKARVSSTASLNFSKMDEALINKAQELVGSVAVANNFLFHNYDEVKSIIYQAYSKRRRDNIEEAKKRERYQCK